MSKEEGYLNFANLVLLKCSTTEYFSVTDFVYEELEGYDFESALPVRTALLNLGYAKKADSGSEHIALTDLGREVRAAGGYFKYLKKLDKKEKKIKKAEKVDLKAKITGMRSSKRANYIAIGALIVAIIAIVIQFFQNSSQESKIDKIERELNILKSQNHKK